MNAKSEPSLTQGRLVVFEGMNGLGKTTQCTKLLSWAEAWGIASCRIKARQSPLVASSILEARAHCSSPLVQVLLFAAGLYDQYQRQALPILRTGGLVISDRWKYSCMAHYEQRGADAVWVESMYSRLPAPDLVVLLVGSAEVALQRIRSKIRPGYWEAGQDVFPGMSRADAFCRFQDECQASLLNQIQRDKLPHLLLTAEMSSEELHASVCQAVSRLLEMA